jgi:hypothetical protein
MTVMRHFSIPENSKNPLKQHCKAFSHIICISSLPAISGCEKKRDNCSPLSAGSLNNALFLTDYIK